MRTKKTHLKCCELRGHICVSCELSSNKRTHLFCSVPRGHICSAQFQGDTSVLLNSKGGNSANKCRWQRRRDRPRPSRPLRVRRWQAAIALLSALARFHDPPHSSSNCILVPRCQPHGTPLTCCTGMLPHTPTPTNTPLGDGTSLNWMPLRAASA